MNLRSRRSSHAAGPVRRAAALAALVFLSGCTAPASEDQSSIQSVLKLNFASWNQVATRELMPAMRDPWLAQHPKQDKVMVTGDYFGTGSNAYATLITKKDKQGRRVRLVVLRPAEAGRFESYILLTESPLDTMPVIHTSKANEYEVNLEGQSVTVPVEGVVYTHPDGRQKLFFWNVDRFMDIELGAEPAAVQP